MSLTNETINSWPNTTSSTNQTATKPYLYNRADWSAILDFLSPWSSDIENLVPSLHYLGMITNFICILVFTSKKLIRRRTIFDLALLAVADMMYNMTSVLPHFLMRTQIFTHNIFKTSTATCFIYDLVVKLFHSYSVLITVLITVDRFNHIHKPLKLARRLDNLKTNKFVAFCLFLVSLLLALPHGFLLVYDEYERECDVREFFRKPILESSSLTLYQLYFTIAEPICLWLLPGLLITNMNFYVVYKIFKTNLANSQRSAMYNSHVQLSHDHTGNVRTHMFQKLLLETRQRRPTWLGRYPLPTNHILTMHTSESNKRSSSSCAISNMTLTKNSRKPMCISVFKMSHYLTILAVGFFFILSTLPYCILLTLKNNLAFTLDYSMLSLADYLSDPGWIMYGRLRDWVSFLKIIFMSNHCFNLFVYFLFDRVFRQRLCDFGASVYRNLFLRVFSCRK